MPLDASVPDSSVAEQLDSALLERLFGNKIITNKTSARLCAAGLWLLYNHLEECHNIAQSIETPDGSYWQPSCTAVKAISRTVSTGIAASASMKFSRSL